MFVVLCGLGAWQVRRLHWKNDLLARIEASERAPPAPLGAAAEPFSKVVATGRFDHAREALLGVEVRGTTLGAHLLTPLLRPALPPLLVDRGWVPLERNRPLDRPEGEVAATGFVRVADRRDWLSPADDAPGRRFYVFDPEAVGAALGLSAPPGGPEPRRSLPDRTRRSAGAARRRRGCSSRGGRPPARSQ